MKAITKNGTVYDVKFLNTKDPFCLYLCEKDERILSWRDFDGLINISGEWYHCLMEAFQFHKGAIRTVGEVLLVAITFISIP